MSNDNFQRWQQIAIDQLGYALNLVLTYAIAALAFWFSLLTDKEFIPAPAARPLMILSLLALNLAVLFGLVCVLNRVKDFRETAQRARKDPEALPRDEVDKLGQRTWKLFRLHIWAFFVGVLLLAISLMLTYGGKLE